MKNSTYYSIITLNPAFKEYFHRYFQFVNASLELSCLEIVLGINILSNVENKIQ